MLEAMRDTKLRIQTYIWEQQRQNSRRLIDYFRYGHLNMFTADKSKLNE